MLVDPPPDYDEAYLTMARRGARVLALAQKSLGMLSHQQVTIYMFFFGLGFSRLSYH